MIGMELEQLAEIIGEVLQVDASEIHVDTDFVEDLGADSLDVYQIVIAVEETLGMELASEAVEGIRTVADALEMINSIQ